MKKSNTLRQTILAVIFALTAVMAFIPVIGFVPGPLPIGINLLLIPTAVAAIVLGKYYGLAAGAFMGLLSFIYAWTLGAYPLEMFFRYPHVSILARVPVGFVMAIVYKHTKRLFRGKDVPACIAGAVAGAITNTVLVFLSLWFTIAVAPNLVPEFEAVRGPFLTLAAIIFSVNFPIEIAALVIIVPPIVYALKRTPQFREQITNYKLQTTNEVENPEPINHNSD